MEKEFKMSVRRRSRTHISSLPAEVLWEIFSYLPAAEILRNRSVCVRWHQVLDEFPKWKYFCVKDFSSVYGTAHRKSPNLPWFNLYKSLYLWSDIKSTNQAFQECVLPDKSKIFDFEIIDDSTVRILQDGSVAYYNLQTREKLNRKTLKGSFLMYKENEHIVAAIGKGSQLYIAKANLSSVKVIPWHVSQLLLIGKRLYCFLDNSIRVCEFINNRLAYRDCAERIPERQEARLKSSHSYLNVPTCNGNIIMLLNDQQQLTNATSISDESYFAEKMYEYNYLNNLKWVLYKWFRPYTEAKTLHVTILAYGDTVFVGTRSGELSIYHVRHSRVLSEFEILASRPILHYNLREMFKLQECQCEIVKIDVIERENGHIVFVAFANKIVAITFNHRFTKLSEAGRSNQNVKTTGVCGKRQLRKRKWSQRVSRVHR